MRKLIIFDCDGVVIDSEIISARMLIEELHLHDVELNLDYVARHFLGRSYPIVLKQIRKDFGITLPDNFEADYRRRLLSAFERDLKVMPGIKEVVDRLAVPYCLATSSSPERVRKSLYLTGMTDSFAGRISTASEVSRGKPAPDLFLHAAKKYDAEPAECLVIEDSRAGIEAGLAAGMEVWHFTGGSHLKGRESNAGSRGHAHRRLAGFREFFQMAPELFRETAPHLAKG
ncbi:HAD family hydrolase [Cohaesibacter sp. ES.047]|uniref:HAD family hydrolase n=1 Tax=Cohaesibacter sp. ES.047 TaxID=1798205 RepID=UPI000BB7BF5B|nr:HAD family hydrolase [Cohaesibacter sp. ES.047]